MNEEKKPLSENLILFIIPIIGLFFAYCYEYGYSMYFNIPFSLIRVDLSSISATILSTLVYLIIIICIDQVLASLMGLFINQIKNRQLLLHILILFFYIFLTSIYTLFKLFLFNNFKFNFLDGCVLVLGATVILHFVSFLPSYFSSKKRNVDILDTAKTEKETKVSFLSFILGSRNFKIIILFIIISGISVIYGRRNAEMQQTFLLVDNNVDDACVKIYNDNMICIPKLQLKNKSIKTIKIYKVQDKIILSKVNISEF